jgi:hypothetical protein
MIFSENRFPLFGIMLWTNALPQVGVFFRPGLVSRETYKVLRHARSAPPTLGGKKVKKGGNKD